MVGAIIGFFPCLGWFNWFNLPVAILGVILSAIALSRDDGESRGMCITGLILSIAAILIGVFRLIIGLGVA